MTEMCLIYRNKEGIPCIHSPSAIKEWCFTIYRFLLVSGHPICSLLVASRAALEFVFNPCDFIWHHLLADISGGAPEMRRGLVLRCCLDTEETMF